MLLDRMSIDFVSQNPLFISAQMLKTLLHIKDEHYIFSYMHKTTFVKVQNPPVSRISLQDALMCRQNRKKGLSANAT